MKIIKMGINRGGALRHTCNWCGCVFEYEQADIHHLVDWELPFNDADENIAWVFINGVPTRVFVICPCCGERVYRVYHGRREVSGE